MVIPGLFYGGCHDLRAFMELEFMGNGPEACLYTGDRSAHAYLRGEYVSGWILFYEQSWIWV